MSVPHPAHCHSTPPVFLVYIWQLESSYLKQYQLISLHWSKPPFLQQHPIQSMSLFLQEILCPCMIWSLVTFMKSFTVLKYFFPSTLATWLLSNILLLWDICIYCSFQNILSAESSMTSLSFQPTEKTSLPQLK